MYIYIFGGGNTSLFSVIFAVSASSVVYSYQDALLVIISMMVSNQWSPTEEKPASTINNISYLDSSSVNQTETRIQAKASAPVSALAV